MLTTLKECKICKAKKVRELFPKRGGRVCKSCYYIAYVQPYRERTYVKKGRALSITKEQRRATGLEHRIEARLWVYEYLKRHPCSYCKEPNPIKLEFHHVGPKRFAISAYLSSGRSGLIKDGKLIGVDLPVPNQHPLEVVMEEIANCQVICRNCHAWVTAQERNTFRYRQWQLDNSGTGS